MDEKPYKGFMIWHLLWSNLGVRPLRSALSVLALSLQVFLVLLIVGLTSGRLGRLAHSRRRSGRGHHRPAAQLVHFLRVFERRDAGIAGGQNCQPSRSR